jgi:hypothetical protein
MFIGKITNQKHTSSARSGICWISSAFMPLLAELGSFPLSPLLATSIAPNLRATFKTLVRGLNVCALLAQING